MKIVATRANGMNAGFGRHKENISADVMRKLLLGATALTVIVAASEASAQSAPDVAQVYSIVKTLQDRVTSLETENRKSKHEAAEARADAKALRQKLESSRPPYAGAAPARAPAAILPGEPPVVTKGAPVTEPRETVVTAVAAPLPNYYTVGVTPFATLPAASHTVPAVMPIRVLPTGTPQLDSLTGGLRLSDNLVFQPYGTITATYSRDSSSPYGLASPSPAFNGDINGPDAFPATHLNARDSIFGANTIWRNAWWGLSVSSKFEFDLNGNFNGGGAGINNVQSLGSYSPRVRLAYGRADLPVTPTTDLFLLAGQDWTPFASSTQPHLLDTATLGAGFGNIWARVPQVRVGVSQELGTPLNFLFQLEGAAVQPGWGNNPTDLTSAGVIVPNFEGIITKLAIGERQGADADRPEFQGRAVLQFQLDPAEGVAPAQLIASGMSGRRTVDILAAEVPAAFKAAFPSGAQLNNNHWGWTVEAQLPTRFLTVSGKYYEGSGLRFYGGGQFFGPFNGTAGLTGTATAQSIDGSTTTVFGNLNGVPVLAPSINPHSSGGFVSVGLPFSRWLGADPQGFNAGWTGYVTAGRDEVQLHDVMSLGGGRQSGNFWAAQLEYRPIPNLILGVELSQYQTAAIPQNATGACPLFQGAHSCGWTNNRVVGSMTFAY